MKTHPAYRRIDAAFKAVGVDLKDASDDQIRFIAGQLDLAFKVMAGRYMSDGWTLSSDYVFNKVGKTRVKSYGGRGKPKKHRMKPKSRRRAA